MTRWIGVVAETRGDADSGAKDGCCQKSVSILHGNVVTLTDDLDSLETIVGSQGGLIQGLYDADYAPKSWVNDKDYATESYVDNSVVSATAISVLIDVALQGTATAAQVTAANQATSDVLDNLTTNYVPRPADWNILSSPDGLKSYVEEKVLAGENMFVNLMTGVHTLQVILGDCPQLLEVIQMGSSTRFKKEYNHT